MQRGGDVHKSAEVSLYTTNYCQVQASDNSCTSIQMKPSASKDILHKDRSKKNAQAYGLVAMDQTEPIVNEHTGMNNTFTWCPEGYGAHDSHSTQRQYINL